MTIKNDAVNEEIVDFEIKLDDQSGISVEEQQEILSDINNITEKNRKSLQGVAAEKKLFKAKKSGRFFPIIVNITAILLLAGGFFLMSSLNRKTDTQIRVGPAVFSSAERFLIDEVRRETSLKISDKEKEMEQFISRMSEIDTELQELYSNNLELTEEQRAAESRLLAMQEDFRAGLLTLQNERSKILEDSRAREAMYRSQFEARTREYDHALQRSGVELDAAHAELGRLTSEQERAASIEAQLASGIASAHEHIRNGKLREAGITLETLRDFLDTPSFRSIRAVQGRKEFYSQTINSMEELLKAAIINQQAGGIVVSGEETKMIMELKLQNEQLEKTNTDLRNDVMILSLDSSEQVQRLQTELLAARDEKAAIEIDAEEKVVIINTLEAQNAALSRSVADQTNRITSIEEILQGKEIADMTLRELNESLEKILSALYN